MEEGEGSPRCESNTVSGFWEEGWGMPRPNIGLRRWGVRAGGQWILPMAGRSVLVALLLVYCAYRCLLSCVF